MDHWNPSVVYEIGTGLHAERIARSEERGDRPPALRAMRQALAAALVALARRLAPAAPVPPTTTGQLTSAR